MFEKVHQASRGKIPSSDQRVSTGAKALARWRAGVVCLGQYALADRTLSGLMDEATVVVARTLRIQYCKVRELLPDGKDLLLRAGLGWKQDCVGRGRAGVERDSRAGYALFFKRPAVTGDLRKEGRLNVTSFGNLADQMSVDRQVKAELLLHGKPQSLKPMTKLACCGLPKRP